MKGSTFLLLGSLRSDQPFNRKVAKTYTGSARHLLALFSLIVISNLFWLEFKRLKFEHVRSHQMMSISSKTFFVVFKLEIYFKGKVVIFLKKEPAELQFPISGVEESFQREQFQQLLQYAVITQLYRSRQTVTKVKWYLNQNNQRRCWLPPFILPLKFIPLGSPLSALSKTFWLQLDLNKSLAAN